MKGFVFSIDALIALTIIIVASTALWTTIPHAAGNEKIFQFEQLQALDAAGNSFLTNELGNEANPNANVQACQEVWKYSFTGNAEADGTINVELFCEGN